MRPLAFLIAWFASACTAAHASASAPAPSAPALPEPELLLSLSFELSTEPGNRAAVVGRLQRTQLFTAGDSLDITQRVSDLRREMIAKYAAPTTWMRFNAVSHELRLGEYRQFITSEKRLATAQAAYRNFWMRQTAAGLVGAGWGAEVLRIDSSGTLAPYLAEFVSREGRTSRAVPILGLWSYDRRTGEALLPSGHFDQVALEWGSPIGNTTYVKADVVHESHWQFAPRWSAGFSVSAGAIRGTGGHLTPIGKRYYGGGVGSVRGYEGGSLGPIDSSGASMGADRKLAGNAEVLWHAFDIGPTPIILSGFGDHGTFYRAEGSTIDKESAGAYGLGISVPMPFGLVRFSFADPRRDTGRTQRFQFDARASWR
ncbi:MAG: BamA/TamA family outer membrane protein [Betaproteobacteria bacterium]|nr:BamA/TamA family outer membrane protein [Betaproteobacteria bacterium]